MEIKVNLPDPYDLEAEHWFAQMRIALKAAEKTYQEAIKGLTEEDIRNIWISFELTGLMNTEKGREALDKIDSENWQSISICIGSL